MYGVCCTKESGICESSFPLLSLARLDFPGINSEYPLTAGSAETSPSRDRTRAGGIKKRFASKDY